MLEALTARISAINLEKNNRRCLLFSFLVEYFTWLFEQHAWKNFGFSKHGGKIR